MATRRFLSKSTLSVKPLRRTLLLQRCQWVMTQSFSTHSTEAPNAQPNNYDTHVPISRLQRSLLMVGSAFAALKNPLRGDMVATLGETTGTWALENMRRQMLESKAGRQILRERPFINSTTIDLDELRRSNPDTFGYQYVNWLDTQGVSPDTREPVHFIDDEELAYVMQRYRQVHDFFHTLTGLGVSVEEELALKWFEWAQTGLPMTMLSSLFGPIILSPQARELLYRDLVPWAIQCGNNATPLITVYFEHHFQTPTVELRRQLGITTPPQNNAVEP